MEDNKENSTLIPYFVHEMNMTRMEVIIKRLWLTILMLILLLVGSNVAWILYESAHPDSITQTQTITQETDQGGSVSFTGDFVGGEAEDDGMKNR